MKNSIKIYSKISLENHEFINVPCTISRNLSLINYEISTLFKSLNLYTLNNKKINKKVKFQWKFLIVKRKFFQNFAAEPRKIGIF